MMTTPAPEFKKFTRTNVAEMRDLLPSESPTGLEQDGVSVSKEDRLAFYRSPDEWYAGKIARNPKNHADQWYVSAAYFRDNFKPAED